MVGNGGKDEKETECTEAKPVCAKVFANGKISSRGCMSETGKEKNPFLCIKGLTNAEIQKHLNKDTCFETDVGIDDALGCFNHTSFTVPPGFTLLPFFTFPPEFGLRRGIFDPITGAKYKLKICMCNNKDLCNKSDLNSSNQSSNQSSNNSTSNIASLLFVVGLLSIIRFL